jgi:hypothetical protein
MAQDMARMLVARISQPAAYWRIGYLLIAGVTIEAVRSSIGCE